MKSSLTVWGLISLKGLTFGVWRVWILKVWGVWKYDGFEGCRLQSIRSVFYPFSVHMNYSLQRNVGYSIQHPSHLHIHVGFHPIAICLMPFIYTIPEVTINRHLPPFTESMHGICSSPVFLIIWHINNWNYIISCFIYSWNQTSPPTFSM